MHAQEVEVRSRARFVHAFQVIDVGHSLGRPVAGRRQARADHQCVWVGLLDGDVASAQQRDVLGRVRLAPAPFARQVGLVPHLISGDLAAITGRDHAAEVGEVLQVAGRAGGDACVLLIGAIPIRVTIQAGEQLAAEVAGQENDVVGPAPVVFALLQLDVAPGEGLFHPIKTGVADEAEVAGGDFGLPPQIRFETITRRFKPGARV